MPATKNVEQKSARAQAVDEEYKELEKRFLVDRRRLILVDGDHGSEGGFGIVRRAELLPPPSWLTRRRAGPRQFVAVKQIKVSALSNRERVKRAFTREMLVWSRLQEHSGISKFLGFWADFKRSEAWLLSPWEPNGNVRDFLEAHKLEVPEKLSLVCDTIDALTFLHQLEPPVCHGDIKSGNVLVSADYKARLCDFGLARLHKDSGFARLDTSTGKKGSIRWCSPELLNNTALAPPSDVYAWAWLVWEIMTGDLPYQDTFNDYAIICKIFQGPLLEVDGQSRLRDCLQLWDLIKRCWNVEPAERPTAGICKTTVTYLPHCAPVSANADDQTRPAALLESLGDLESWKGNLEGASASFNEALRLYQKASDTKGIASVLLKQAAAAHRIEDYVKLRTIATTALEDCKNLDDRLGIAQASFYLASSDAILGNLDEALAKLRESLDIRREHGDDIGVTQCLERMGEIQRAKDQKQEALSTLGEAMEIASRSGNRLGLASALHVVGITHTDLSNFADAADALSEAIMITRSVGWDGELSMNLLAMGRLRMRQRKYSEAEQDFQESISIARRIGARFTVARGLDSLGECFQEQSKPNEAAPLLEEACRLWDELSQPKASKGVASSLVDLKSSQGDWDSALRWLDHIIAVCCSEKQHLEMAQHLLQKAEILENLQRHDEAASYFEAVKVICRENGYLWRSERK